MNWGFLKSKRIICGFVLILILANAPYIGTLNSAQTPCLKAVPLDHLYRGEFPPRDVKIQTGCFQFGPNPIFWWPWQMTAPYGAINYLFIKDNAFPINTDATPLLRGIKTILDPGLKTILLPNLLGLVLTLIYFLALAVILDKLLDKIRKPKK